MRVTVILLCNRSNLCTCFALLWFILAYEVHTDIEREVLFLTLSCKKSNQTKTKTKTKKSLRMSADSAIDYSSMDVDKIVEQWQKKYNLAAAHVDYVRKEAEEVLESGSDDQREGGRWL